MRQLVDWISGLYGSLSLSWQHAAPDHLVCRKQDQSGYDSDTMIRSIGPICIFWPMQTQSCTAWFSPHVIYTDTHLHTFTVHRSFQIHLNARSSEQIPANLDCAKVYTIRFSGYISIYSNTPISTSQSNGM